MVTVACSTRMPERERASKYFTRPEALLSRMVAGMEERGMETEVMVPRLDQFLARRTASEALIRPAPYLWLNQKPAPLRAQSESLESFFVADRM